MTISSQQAAAVAALKEAADPARVSLAVLDDEGRLTARLIPIGHSNALTDEVLQNLFRWRQGAMRSFLTVFEPSLEKTRGYLEAVALADSARLLFLIEDAEGRAVGNIGLCNITAADAEIDNVIRGESVGRSDFMTWVLRALIRFAHDRLNVERVYLNVLADNERAIRSYQRVGMVETNRVPLAREDIPGGYRWTPSPGMVDPSMALVRMETSPV